MPTARLLRVPASLGDDAAAMIEPLAVATHDVRRAEVKAGDAVLVFGGGPIGALIAMVCRHRGARVVVSEVNPFRVKMLTGLGIDVVGPERDLKAFVQEWTSGDGADIVFEVTGNPAAVSAMTDLVRVWGTISMVAIHGAPPVNLYQFFARELTMHGSRLYSRRGLGGGDPAGRGRRCFTGAPGQPAHPPGIAAAGHGRDTARWARHEGADRPQRLTAMPWHGGCSALLLVARQAKLPAIVSDSIQSARRAGLRYIGAPRDGHQSPPIRPRVLVPRRRRPPRDRSRHAPAHPRAGDPAGVDGRVDLPVAQRSRAGLRPRRARAQAVPLSRPLARDARREQVRAHAGLRSRAAAHSRAGRARPGPARLAAREGPGHARAPARDDADPDRQRSVSRARTDRSASPPCATATWTSPAPRCASRSGARPARST